MLEFILGLIGMILYPLFSIIFVFLDTLQSIFYALAGIGNVGIGDSFWVTTITATNGGNEKDTGLIFYLLNTPLIKNMLISMMVLAIFLLIIFTVMAFIKNAYAAKQKTWKEIIGNAIKGLANFIFIPVCCLLGIWASNILLNAINGATSSGGSELMSRKLFIAAAYSANHYRSGTAIGKGTLAAAYALALYGDKPFDINDIPEEPTDAEARAEYKALLADYMDQLFASGSISIYDQVSVGFGYQLWSINYLVLIVGGVFMMYVLITIAYAMVRRMFFLLMLYIISPAICAMYPLDEGKAVGTWKSEFLKNTIAAYGAVAGMNIFLSLLPIVGEIQISGGYSSFWAGLSTLINEFLPINTIVQLLIMVAGLFVVKELISTISSMIGGADAYSQGSSLRSNVKSKIKQAKEKVGKAGAFVASEAGKYKALQNTSKTPKRDMMKDWTKRGASFMLKSSTGIDLKGMKDGFKKGKEEKENAEILRAQKNVLDDILNTLKTGGGASNPAAADAAIKSAKKLGVEDQVLDIIAKQRNQEAIKNGTFEKAISGSDIKEDRDKVKDLTDAEKAYRDRKKMTSNYLTDSANARYQSRMKGNLIYSSEEIEAALPAARADMIASNKAVSEYQRRLQEEESALSEYKAKAIAATKLKTSEFSDIGSDMKAEDVVKAFQDLENGVGTGIAAVETMVTAKKAKLDQFIETEAETLNDNAKEIKSRMGKK